MFYNDQNLEILKSELTEDQFNSLVKIKSCLRNASEGDAMIIALLSILSQSGIGGGGSFNLSVSNDDGSVSDINDLFFEGGVITDLGGGQVSINIPSSGGGGTFQSFQSVTSGLNILIPDGAPANINGLAPAVAPFNNLPATFDGQEIEFTEPFIGRMSFLGLSILDGTDRGSVKVSAFHRAAANPNFDIDPIPGSVFDGYGGRLISTVPAGSQLIPPLLIAYGTGDHIKFQAERLGQAHRLTDFRITLESAIGGPNVSPPSSGPGYVVNEAALSQVGDYTYSADGNERIDLTGLGVRRHDISSE